MHLLPLPLAPRLPRGGSASGVRLSGSRALRGDPLAGRFPRRSGLLWSGGFLSAPADPMGFRPVVPVGHRVAYGPEEVVRPAVGKELEAFLEISRELLVVVERSKVFPEPAAALEVEDGTRVVDDGGDLRPASYHARVTRKCVDLAVAHARDSLDIEAAEGGLDRGPLRVDDPPADPRLEDALAELLEVVVDSLRSDARGRFHQGVTLRRKGADRAAVARVHD